MGSDRRGATEPIENNVPLQGERRTAEAPPPALAPLLDSFAGLDVLVLGDSILDRYLEGSVARIAREAPVPVLSVSQRLDAAGGAANTAANASALGARTRLLSAVGDDADGVRLLELLSSAGVEVDGVIRSAHRRTVLKQRLVADGHVLGRVDEGTTAEVDAATERELAERLAREVERADAIVVSDYGAGVVTPRIAGRLARARDGGRPILVVDGKDLRCHRELRATAVTPNYDEAVRVLGSRADPREGGRPRWAAAHASELLAGTGADIVAVTLDRDGAVTLEPGADPYRTYADDAPERS